MSFIRYTPGTKCWYKCLPDPSTGFNIFQSHCSAREACMGSKLHQASVCIWDLAIDTHFVSISNYNAQFIEHVTSDNHTNWKWWAQRRRLDVCSLCVVAPILKNWVFREATVCLRNHQYSRINVYFSVSYSVLLHAFKRCCRFDWLDSGVISFH